ncbi:hypothetical protein AMBR_NBBOBCOC_02840 [Lacticaseibacillus rhamnosus]|nr:hypothetical protein AMBR_NBBOBCOC_02840 [Lacticaseibacillus rhamnosus]
MFVLFNFGMNSTNIVADHLDLIGDYAFDGAKNVEIHHSTLCLLYTSPSPRDVEESRMPSSA